MLRRRAARYPVRMTSGAAPGLDRILVSCLMVALPSPRRLRHFERSVSDYCRQTHPSRELVVVLDRGDPDARDAMAAHLAALRRDDIRVVEPSRKLSLGALRNASIVESRGDVLCVWDDDDMHHPARVRTQLAELVRARARSIVLVDVLQYFSAARALHWTNWQATTPKGLPGTLMFRRSATVRYPEAGPESARSEDMAGIAQLQAAGGYVGMAGAPHLYVYVFHGANTWAENHHAAFARDLTVGQARLRRHEALLRRGLSAFDFGSGDVAVTGPQGVAFALAGGAR